jgi:hypothetical protein
MSLKDEINRAGTFGQKIEDLVIRKGQGPAGDRDTLLTAYWSLIFDFHRGILVLVSAEYFGAAFALVRPVMESLVRSHLALMGSDEEVEQLRKDEYRVNFKEIGPRIDKFLGLSGFFERILDRTRNSLHSYTHAGLAQLGRRFSGDDPERCPSFGLPG